MPSPARAMGARRGVRGGSVILLAVSLIVILPTAHATSATAGAYPPLPVEDGRMLLGNLSASSLVAGSSGSLGFTVENPLPSPLTGAELTLDLYAFNAFPGNATSTVPVSGAPVLTTATTSGYYANVSVGSLLPGAVYIGSIGVATASSTPSGTFAVRAALTFTSDGTPYLFESRGWFSSAAWTAATELPNGSVTLNLTRLGVSGVLPETAVYVSSAGFDWALGVLAAVGVVLVGAAAWVYFRRGPGSTSGTR